MNDLVNYQEKTNRLFEEQRKNWSLLGKNRAMLKDAQLKKFSFEGFTIQVQFNPKRIKSSAAKVDKKSIEKRSCFLCSNNRPDEQDEVNFDNRYQILCNPFPIFKKHFTIATPKHTPQVIDPEFPGFLDLSRSLPELVIFYNAPSCGASAPDHMHFQAGNRGFMPIETEINNIKKLYGNVLIENRNLKITAVDDRLRRFILMESEQKEELNLVFKLISAYTRQLNGGEEPMLNILSYYQKEWQIMVFPREKHRPWQYFAKGEQNILLSPASVDMGGMLITPLEKDFLKINREDITDIFSQIVLPKEKYNGLIEHIQQLY